MIDDVTGIILVGGKSTRLGRDKAFLEIDGAPLFERVLTLFRHSFSRILLVGDRPQRFTSYGLEVIPDIHPGSSLGGLHAGLSHAATPFVFASPCDLPFPSAAVMEAILSHTGEADAVAAESACGPEPLFALYSRGCLPAVERLLAEGDLRTRRLFDLVPTLLLRREQVAALPGAEKAFVNLNTPGDYSRIIEDNLP